MVTPFRSTRYTSLDTGVPVSRATATLGPVKVPPKLPPDAASGAKLVTSVAPAGPPITRRAPSAVAAKPPVPAPMASARACAILPSVSTTTRPLPRFTPDPITTANGVPLSVTRQMSPVTGVPARSTMKADGVAAALTDGTGVMASVGTATATPRLTMMRPSPRAAAVKLPSPALPRTAAASTSATRARLSTTTLRSTATPFSTTVMLAVAPMVALTLWPPTASCQTSPARSRPVSAILKACTAVPGSAPLAAVPAAVAVAVVVKLPPLRLTMTSRSPSTIAV